MTKATMLKYYRNASAAGRYIIGFEYKHEIYMTEVKEIMPRFLAVEKASGNRGESLRLRLHKAHKEQLLRNKTCIALGSDSQLKDKTYNKGEIFEKLVTEHYGQTWKKDTVPFWVCGDIQIDGVEVQIKFDSASLLNTNQIEKVLKKSTKRG